MTPVPETEAPERSLLPASSLPSSMTSVFGSMQRSGGRLAVPPGLHLKVAFGELKLDLRDAVFPHQHIQLVSESLCASVEVLLPEGVTVADDSIGFLSSHKLSQAPEGLGPVIHLDGWSICSDVKFVTAGSADRSIKR
jgi:hypothetical protein